MGGPLPLCLCGTSTKLERVSGLETVLTASLFCLAGAVLAPRLCSSVLAAAELCPALPKCCRFFGPRVPHRVEWASGSGLSETVPWVVCRHACVSGQRAYSLIRPILRGIYRPIRGPLLSLRPPAPRRSPVLLPVSSQGVLPAPRWPVVSQMCYSYVTDLNSPQHSAPHSMGFGSVDEFGIDTSRIL